MGELTFFCMFLKMYCSRQSVSLSLTSWSNFLVYLLPPFTHYNFGRTNSQSGMASRESLAFQYQSSAINLIMVKSNIAIVGAGMSALACARILSKSFNVFIFQKSRVVGGRISSIRNDNWLADQGAPYYTATSQSFKKINQQLMKRQIVQKWNAKFGIFDGQEWSQSKPQTRYVGKPGMEAIANQLSRGLNIKLQSQVKKVSKNENKWLVQLQAGIQPHVFDKVIITAPQHKAMNLVQPHSNKLYQQCRMIRFFPSITAVAVYKEPVKIPFDAAVIENNGVIQWIANNSTKPGRKTQPHVWVIQCTGWFSEQNWELKDYLIRPAILHQFKKLGAHKPDSIQIHRWKQANCNTPLKVNFSRENQLYVIGDWLNEKGNVEGAYLSGQSLAEHILAQNKS